MADGMGYRAGSIGAILSILLLVLPAASHGQGMTKSRATVHHIANDFKAAELDNASWKRAEMIEVASNWNGSEAPDGRRFTTRVLWSDAALYVRFDAKQAEPLVVSQKPDLSKKTMRLWDRDVCELFLAPDRNQPKRYAEFEIAPTGEWLDLMVDWTKDEPRDWAYMSGMQTFAKIERDKVTMAMKIPWTAFARKPVAGDVWVGNIFRQVGSGETRGYLAWRPTMTEKPNFHVPEKFGEFEFVN